MTMYEAALLKSLAEGHGVLAAVPGKHKDSGEEHVILCYMKPSGVLYPICRLPPVEETEKLAACYTIFGEKAVANELHDPVLRRHAHEPVQGRTQPDKGGR